jgi:glycosyltransferase involved in cell wall biosynthesis
VTIAEDFRSELLRWGLPAAKLHLIENWAPLEELPQRPRANAWAREHGLADKRVLLYSGTLGRKHDPGLLLRLALELREEQDVRVVVVSEGAGGDWLARESAAVDARNLLLLGFQPYEALADVLASGDVLLVLLEREAGRYAVPSKVLSYLCAARPLLAAVPAENLGAKVVSESGGGVVAEPGDADGLVAAARRLLDDPSLRADLGAAARAYAEATFDIQAIGDRFEQVLSAAAQVRSRP